MRELSNSEKLLFRAFEQLKLASEAHKHNTNTQYAAEMYRNAISSIGNYFRYPFINNKIENLSSAFYCRAEASYCLATICYKENISESNTLFMQAAKDSIDGLNSISDSQERREVYLKTIKNSLLSIQKNFKKNQNVNDIKIYLNEFLPSLKKGLEFIYNNEEYHELQTAFNTFENYFSNVNIPSLKHPFWNNTHLSQIGNENINPNLNSNQKLNDFKINRINKSIL